MVKLMLHCPIERNREKKQKAYNLDIYNLVKE